MHVDEQKSLAQLRAEFLETSTLSMPIAGMLFWTAAVIASRLLHPLSLAFFVGFGSGTVFPLGLLLDRLRGRNQMGDPKHPITSMFMQGLVSAVLLWPLVILAGQSAPGLVVLGASVLMGIVWIPYGWAADDPVGLRHGVIRALASYAVYVLTPSEFKLTAVCAVPILCYGYSLLAMKKPPATGSRKPTESSAT